MQLKVTNTTVGNFHVRDEHWKDAVSRYMGESGEEAETGDNGANEAEAGNEQDNDGDDSNDSNYNDTLSSEDNTGEFSNGSIEPLKRVVRIVGPGEVAPFALD
ncbi:hypothetical protein BGZ49_009180 [Haplosporangium sp. Z 27]|nr:hypothetical protein BGZ49_009180 [Haplosporangium sp. Z 27]